MHKYLNMSKKCSEAKNNNTFLWWTPVSGRHQFVISAILNICTTFLTILHQLIRKDIITLIRKENNQRGQKKQQEFTLMGCLWRLPYFWDDQEIQESFFYSRYYFSSGLCFAASLGVCVSWGGGTMMSSARWNHFEQS